MFQWMLQGRISLLILYVKPRTGNLNDLQVTWPHFEGQTTGIDSRQSPHLKGRLRAHSQSQKTNFGTQQKQVYPFPGLLLDALYQPTL